MGVTSLEEKGIAIAPIFIIIFIFFIPISPTFKSTFLFLSIGTLISIPYYRKLSFYTWTSLWGITAVAFLLFVIIASLWSPAPYSMQWMVIGKYFKLFYLPILAVGFVNPKIRTWSLNSYLAAMSITCILTILKSKGFLVLGETTDQGEVFYNHILTGFMVSFASYLAGLFAFQYKGKLRAVYLTLLLLMSYQVIFINTGRTGYITYFILMILLLAQKLSLKRAAIGVLVFCSLFVLSYNVSVTMHMQVNALINDMKLLKENHKETSLGYRLEFHDYAKYLFEEHPILGVGTGGFKYRFSEDNPIPSWGRELNDPHSQYWMTMAEQGMVGFFLFVCFLTSLFVGMFQLKETRSILFGFLVVFCIGCMSDTIFCYSTAGYLLIVFSALCFGEWIEEKISHEVLENKRNLRSNFAIQNKWVFPFSRLWEKESRTDG